jgi:hypothetical protein
MKAFSAVVVTAALFAGGSTSTYAENQHLRPKQECVDLAHARGFDRSQGQHGMKNSDMSQFVYNCRRGLVK